MAESRTFFQVGTLIIPADLATLPDPVVVVQTLGEANALWTAGLTAVGLGSTDDESLSRLALLLKGREVVVLGSADCQGVPP